MKKGVSSIIALILIVMITVSLGGFIFLYLSRTLTTTTSSADEALENMENNAPVFFDMEYASGNSIYVRNVGMGSIRNKSVTVYINNELVPNSINAEAKTGEIANITVSNLWKYASKDDINLKLSGAGTSREAGIHIKPKTNPVLYYSMDSFNVASPSNVTDNSGSGYTGTKYGYVSYVAGKFGNGTNFTGKYGDYIDSINYPNLNIVGALTLSAWVNPRKAISVNTNIIAKRNASLGTPYLFALTPTGLEFDYSNAASAWFMGTATATIPVGAWTHVMVTRSATNSITYYVNGANIFTQAGGITASANTLNLRIGDDGDATRAVFNGTIDEVMIFNTAIIPDQMFTFA